MRHPTTSFLAQGKQRDNSNGVSLLFKDTIMKTFFGISLLVLFSTSISGQNLKSLDDKYGFRGAKFETPFDSLKNLVEIEKGFYTSTSEDLKLGEYDLSQIVYSFYKGQLYIIGITTKGYTNSNGILSILQQAYGKGYQSNEYIEKYIWFGKKVIMSYEQNSATRDATVFIMCRKLSDLKEADEKKANEEAAKQL